MPVGSFSAAISGLNANATYLSVIGNNLANLNTVGFKASSVNFVDLVSHHVGGGSANPMQVGLGVTTGSISPIFSQGAPQSTRESTNVALQGHGFFVVRQESGNAYTRDGSFSFDRDGKLVTSDGLAVQGWTLTDPATGKILTNGQLSDITVPPGVLRAPVATSQFSTLTNLNAKAAVGDTFTSAVQMYDKLGTSHVVTIAYTKTGPGAWSFAVTVPGEDVRGGTAGTPFEIGAGSVAFDENGLLSNLTSEAVAGAPRDIQFMTPAWTNGAAASTLTWDLVDADGTPALTGYDAASATSSKTQNGSSAGMVDVISILPDGTIQATFGAGEVVAVGKIAVANFNNPKGLLKLGSNRYGESQAAGIANIGEAGTGGRGTLIGSALEQSNVDIAQEFTQMILAQRGYQANSKTITVSDELLVDTLQLKR